jgi:hypothetical protein
MERIMGVRIRLENGGLYETIDGNRLRLTEVQEGGQVRFVCPKATCIQWCLDGFPSSGKNGDFIARKIEEYRWIPMHALDTRDLKMGGIYRVHRGHIQLRVTRQEAQALAPNHPSKQPAPVPVKELTVAEISALLGYQVKVVA